MKVSPCCGVESSEANGASVYGCVTCRICGKNGMEIEETEFELKKYQRNKPMPKKYILNHDTPEYYKGTIFTLESGYFQIEGMLAFRLERIVTGDLSYWFTEVKEESDKDKEKAMCICERCGDCKEVGKVTVWSNTPKVMMKYPDGRVKTIGGLKGISALCVECAKEVYDKEKIKRLEKEVEELKKENKRLESLPHCQHETDEAIYDVYLTHPAKYKCKKCGDFYT